ncbi:hypothetical protein ACFQ0M_25540 [Kitasatospora aburaviensis]
MTLRRQIATAVAAISVLVAVAVGLLVHQAMIRQHVDQARESALTALDSAAAAYGRGEKVPWTTRHCRRGCEPSRRTAGRGRCWRADPRTRRCGRPAPSRAGCSPSGSTSRRTGRRSPTWTGSS